MDPQHCHQGYEYSLAPIIKPAYATDYYPSAPQQFVLEEYRYIIYLWEAVLRNADDVYPGSNNN
jgi:hypothetical protein